MRFYFCWERNFRGDWSPVVYHGEMPRRNCRDMEPDRTVPVEISPEFIDEDTPNFGRLVKAYPAPMVAE